MVMYLAAFKTIVTSPFFMLTSYNILLQEAFLIYKFCNLPATGMKYMQYSTTIALKICQLKLDIVPESYVRI